MENVLYLKDTNEMQEIAGELFSVIPNIDKAVSVSVVQADRLTEKEFASNWVAKNTACLIKGAVRSWPAVEKWKKKEYWVNTCRNEERKIITHMNYYGWSRKNAGSVQMPFHDAMERLFNNVDHIFSIPSQVVNEQSLFGGIIKDLPGFSFLKPGPPPLIDQPRGLFIYRRASTAWHVHNCDETLMCQVKGAKKVALLPSWIPQARLVTEFLEKEKYLEGGRLDKALDLQPRIALVEEGDALYIPPHWFHCVVPLDGELGFTSLTVFRSPWHVYGNFSSYFVRRLYKMAFRNANAGLKCMIPVWGIYAALRYYLRRLTGRPTPRRK